MLYIPLNNFNTAKSNWTLTLTSGLALSFLYLTCLNNTRLQMEGASFLLWWLSNIRAKRTENLDRRCVWPSLASMTGNHHKGSYRRPWSQPVDRLLLAAYFQSLVLRETDHHASPQPTPKIMAIHIITTDIVQLTYAQLQIKLVIDANYTAAVDETLHCASPWKVIIFTLPMYGHSMKICHTQNWRYLMFVLHYNYSSILTPVMPYCL